MTRSCAWKDMYPPLSRYAHASVYLDLSVCMYVYMCTSFCILFLHPFCIYQDKAKGAPPWVEAALRQPWLRAFVPPKLSRALPSSESADCLLKQTERANYLSPAASQQFEGMGDMGYGGIKPCHSYRLTSVLRGHAGRSPECYRTLTSPSPSPPHRSRCLPHPADSGGVPLQG